MKLTLDALQILDAIDRKGSFAAAAIELQRVPSAITYSVRKLEEELDVLLFDRSAKRAMFTPAGLELLVSGRRMLAAADAIEKRVHRVATGWESELRIAVDTVIPLSTLHPLIEQFHAEGHGTSLRFSHEVLGGSWEAMRLGRADIVIGAPGALPGAMDCRAQKIGELRMIFAVAAHHPLVKVKRPLEPEDLLPYRVVAVADSSRVSTPMTSGILEGQAVLTVPDMQAKLDAQRMGLGVGQLPFPWIATYLASGQLIEKSLAQTREAAALYLLTPKKPYGKALKWWADALTHSRCLAQWLH